ncbi:MAG: hypothetical protein WC005_00080 [Candidatus Nanopelagicales bacterium]
MRSTLAVAAAATFVIGAALAPLAQAAPAAPSKTKIVACTNAGTVLETKPKSYILTCADANSLLKDLKWSSWTSGTAKATGIFQENDCKPNCAAGKFIDAPATVSLTVPKTIDGNRVFTSITVTTSSNGKTHRQVYEAPRLTK